MVAEEPHGQFVLREGLAEVVHDLGGGVGHPVEDPRHSGVDAVRGADPGRGDVSGRPEQVIAFVRRQAQAPRDGRQHPLGRLGTPPLLDPAVVVGRHAAEGGHLTDDHTGQIDINGAQLNLLAPFGGHKQSGNGREMGRSGLEEFTEVTAIQR
ncbi:aldehyde dehydrogenase family protein [Streptomyces sp. SID4948]|nr:aldehyde dehydrogenase family protein [Streptomyces sp. SID4948]